MNEQGIPLTSEGVFRNHVRALQIVRANISESPVILFVMQNETGAARKSEPESR